MLEFFPVLSYQWSMESAPGTLAPESSLNLRALLAPVARRMRLQVAIRAATLVLLATSVIWTILLGCSKFFLLPPWLVPALLVAGGALTFVWAAIAAGRGPTLFDAAKLVDRRLGLKDRLSTLFELDRQADHSEIAGLLRRDTAKHVQHLAPRELAPLSLPRHARWTLAALGLAAVVVFLPEVGLDQRMKKVAENERIKGQGERLQLMVRRVTETPRRLNTEQRVDVLAKIDEIGKRLSSGDLAKNEALRELTKLTDELTKRERTLADKNPVKSLDRETMRDRDPISPERLEALQDQINALQEKLGQSPPSEKDVRKLAKALQKARETAKDAQMSAAGHEALADALNEALSQADAAQLKEISSELREAIQALEAADVAKVFKHLDDAIMDLDQARQQVAALQELMKQAAEAGKNLAEQLERGQSRLAQKTIQEFKRQVDAAGLTPEQREQLANELAKALGPARDYGELSQTLQDALDQAKRGDQPGLSQSLQNAMDQLQQMADQQAQQAELAKMINELQRAGFMISMGRDPGDKMNGAGQCLGLNQGDPTQKPGRGVGAWPDQNGMPQYTERWDNTGVNQADQAARGHTDRGDPLAPQGTQTLKVTGQMGTGGPMPGIRLQGVSIRGESNVKVEEAFSSAAQEAENALSKETVPTSYQGAVKEYFDIK